MGVGRNGAGGRGRHRAAPSLRARLRRAVVVLVASFSAMLGVSAAGVAGPPNAVVDQRFLADLRDRGHPVAPGSDEELLVSAGLKMCELRDNRTYVRRQGTLTGAEVAAVRRVFGDDPQAFVRFATKTYCS